MTTRARAGSLVCAALMALVMCAPAAADAAPDADVRGRVETATSRWTADGDVILTDVVVLTADGRRITVTTPGGSVGGIGMSFSHHDAALRPDDEVVLVAERHGLRAQRVGAPRIAPDVSRAGETPGVGVQRTSLSGRTLHHASGCIAFVSDGGGTDQLAGDVEWDAVDDALGAWEAASMSLSCGRVALQRQVMANAPDGRDGINTIQFRDDRWCRPATLTEPELCHAPGAVAITRLIFIDDPASPRDGEILEADIEINAVDFTLAIDGRAGAIDLASAVAHEIGHALGLDHNCGIEGDGVWPMGADGTLVASCESAGPELGAATMYFQVAPGTVTMRSPAPSDLDGLCTVLDSVCAIELTGGCAASAPGDAGATPLLWGLLVGLVAAGRRLVRRRRRS